MMRLTLGPVARSPRRSLSRDRSAARLRPSSSERASGSKGGCSPRRSTNERGPAQARARDPNNLASGCDAGVPMSGKARSASCCLSGTGAPPGRRGEDTRTMLAARSGQGHVRASTGLPTPCRREDSLHVSQPRLDRASWRYSQREVVQAAVVPDPNDCPPCPSGDMPSDDGPGSSPGKVVGSLRPLLVHGPPSLRLASRASRTSSADTSPSTASGLQTPAGPWWATWV